MDVGDRTFYFSPELDLMTGWSKEEKRRNRLEAETGLMMRQTVLTNRHANISQIITQILNKFKIAKMRI